MRTPGRGVLVAGAALGALLAMWRAVAPPTTTQWQEIDAWQLAEGPEAVVLLVLWSVAVVVATWLLAACVLQALASWSAAGWADAWAARITPAILRRAFGSSVAASLLVAPVVPAGAGDGGGTATMRPLAVEETTSSTISPTTTVATTPPAPPATTAPPPAAPAAPVTVIPPAGEEEITVDRGDSCWTIAEAHLADSWGRRASDVEVTGYWQRLLEVNRARFMDPDNPDLLYAGQVLVLPPV